jgi:hypothetical protein
MLRWLVQARVDGAHVFWRRGYQLRNIEQRVSQVQAAMAMAKARKALI